MTDTDPIPLPQNSPFSHMPEPVLRTLYRSYIDRVNKVKGALGSTVPASYCSQEHFPKSILGTLDQAWWGLNLRDPTQYPATFSDALMRVPPSSLNIVVIIYERMKDIDSALWDSIRWIRNIWVVDSAGFKCEYVHRGAMAFQYSSLTGTVCMDTKGIFQDGDGKKELIGGGQEHPGCDTWREVTSGSTPWGLHFLVGNRRRVAARSDNAVTLGELETANRSLDEIHLDWIDPVEGSNQEGYCNYDHWKSVQHLRQVKAGSGLPRSPFMAREDISAVRGYITFLKSANVSSAADFETRCNSLETTLNTLDLRELACEGKAGWDDLDSQVGKSLSKLVAEAKGAKESWLRSQK